MAQTVLPAFSVAIVTVLCVTRTVQLFLLVTRPNKKAIFSILILYLAYLIISEAVPVLCGVFRFIYTPTEIYCWDIPSDPANSGSAAYVEIAMDWISFSIPVLPILVCCVVSTTKIWRSRKVVGGSAAPGKDLKTRATVTILIFTAVYIVFNIPIFLVQLLRVLLFVHHEGYPGRYFSNYFMYQYGWNITKMLLPVMNSAINPVIYFTRMLRFRKWIMSLRTRPNEVVLSGVQDRADLTVSRI